MLVGVPLGLSTEAGGAGTADGIGGMRSTSRMVAAMNTDQGGVADIDHIRCVGIIRMETYRVTLPLLIVLHCVQQLSGGQWNRG